MHSSKSDMIFKLNITKSIAMEDLSTTMVELSTCTAKIYDYGNYNLSKLSCNFGCKTLRAYKI